MKSLPGYFEDIASTKTYIGKYPASIIDLDALLNGGFLIEFGSGAGNDIKWLFEHGKRADSMCSFEPDVEACWRLRYNLDGLLGCWSILHLPLSAFDSNFSDGSANYVYANNMLHCLGNEDNVYACIEEAYRLLKRGGVFFGRTLSDKIDVKRIAEVKRKQRELIARALAEPPPERVECLQVFSRTTDCSTGISVFRTAIYDSQTPEGVARLERYNQEKESRRKYEEIPDKKEAFALSTVRALQDGRLVGVAPEKLENMARSVGFNRNYTEVRDHPWKPTADYFFRFEKLN